MEVPPSLFGYFDSYQQAYFSVLHWSAVGVQLIVLTIGLAAALYYLAELVEEYTSIAAKWIRVLLIVTTVLQFGMFFVDEFPWYVPLSLMAGHVCYGLMFARFPSFEPVSPGFIGAFVMAVANHWLGIQHFATNFHPFHEVVAYFIMCLWLVPFAFLVSLSAGDNTLPSWTASPTAEAGDQPFFGDELASGDGQFDRPMRKRKYGLRGLLDYLRVWLTPGFDKRRS